MTEPSMVVESWPVDRVVPYEKNPRRNDAAVDSVARSIQQYGFRQPIVVDKKGVVIVGHTRLKAAKQLGMTHVPVHVAKDLSASKASALRDKYASKWDSILGSRRIDGGAGVRADSMAQVGGFVGGGRGALGIADRQLKMQTESNRIQTEIKELNRQINEALQEIRASNGGTFQGSV